MFGTNLAAPTMITDTIRWVFAMLDRPFYWLLTIMYQIFFNVSSAQLFDQTVSRFFGRVQLIIGVYMMFQLAVTILKGIVDPDTFTKNEGGSKGVIVRIIIALLMLAVLMPIKVPNPTREFDQQISNQGLLFGTLNSLQYRIVSNNTLGRLILGTKDDDGNYLSGGDDIQQELEDSAKIFSSSVLKTFYRINLIPEKERKHEEGKTDDMINDNRLCTDIDDQTLETYTKLNANPTEIIDLVNRTCTTQYDTSKSIWNLWGTLGSDVYMFDYTPILSLIVAVVFCVILLSFTMDVVVRSAKLAFLRLLAPIPIISYMDPNGSKDGAFNSWWKTLLSTYIDLFVRLSIIYFIIFIIQDMMINGIVINNVEGPIGLVSLVLIYIGLFAFAKQAPKFIREVLGMKGEGGNFFSGLEAIGTAAGMGAAALGTVGSGIASATASHASDMTKYKNRLRDAHPDWDEDQIKTAAENMAGRVGNRAKHIAAGIAGGVMGGVTGATALAGAKNNYASAVMNAVGKRNAAVLSSGRDGGTLFGAVGAQAGRLLTGEYASDSAEAVLKGREEALKNDELRLKTSQNANARRKSIMDRAASKAVDSEKTTGTYGGITGNYRSYHSAFTAAQAGTGVGKWYSDGYGNHISESDYQTLLRDHADSAALFSEEGEGFIFNDQFVSMAQAQSIDMGLKDANADSFYQQALADASFDDSITADVSALGGVDHVPSSLAGSDGLKAAYGKGANADKTASDRIAKEREAISEARRKPEAQADAANAKRFGGGGS